MLKAFISAGESTFRVLRFSIILFLLSSLTANSQVVKDVILTANKGLNSGSLLMEDSTILKLGSERPLFSFVLNGKNIKSDDLEIVKDDVKDDVKDIGITSQFVTGSLTISYRKPEQVPGKWTGEFVFENDGQDTLTISNFVPFGEDRKSVFLTGYGPPDLARACLFRPGYRPVRVILPDNAWEMGYTSFIADNDLSVASLARRKNSEGGVKRRYETVLPPKAKVTYIMHCELYHGDWHEGLRLMFRDRYLYDLDKFDNTLYERPDLQWIKESYLIVLQMAWDREFYDRLSGRYTYADFLKQSIARFGYLDVFGIWPTWPRLGLDNRNQWDLYRDLPGGTGQLRNFARMSRPYGTRFFIAYNPWDNSTRKEDHYKGMAKLISETEADGVVLDTRGSSSYELQAAADSVRKGVIMFSEGMAVIKDMPGIISGRVHNAIFLSPELNLNKLVKPDFSIFRVADIGEDIIHREIAIAFFNGYGTELNMFRPGGRDENYESDLDFLASTTFTLRQNNDAFLDYNWTPLIETITDNVYVNRWESGEKTIFTILNMKPEGISGKLFSVENKPGIHYVSVWNHKTIVPINENGKLFLPADAEGWPAEYSGTRREGSVDCIAGFPRLINPELDGDSIKVEGSGNGKIIFWKGNPSYKTLSREFRIINDTIVTVKDLFGYYEGKVVIQLVDNKILRDEEVLLLKGRKPWLISRKTMTDKAVNIPKEMVLVPGTRFSFEVNTADEFMPYPDVSNIENNIDSFLIDRYPVTNEQYFNFVISSRYIPSDTTRYLRNWSSGTFIQGQEKYPVVYVSYEDMQAYAKWAGKRLPTQAEWQLAAQGTGKNLWPWGNEFHGTYCNNGFDRPTPVDAFPKGQSPYGAMDMVGNVWQMTNDMYFNGTSYFTIIRGGSYYKPESSWWYIQGGPQQLDKTQIMLLVSPGFDRSATVGFRCVKDIDSRNFKNKQ